MKTWHAHNATYLSGSVLLYSSLYRICTIVSIYNVSECKAWKNYGGSDRLLVGRIGLFLTWKRLDGLAAQVKLCISLTCCLHSGRVLRITPSHYSVASADCGLVKSSRNAASGLISAVSLLHLFTHTIELTHSI